LTVLPRWREMMVHNLELFCCLLLLDNLTATMTWLMKNCPRANHLTKHEVSVAIDKLDTYSLLLIISLLTLTLALRSCATLLTETEWLLNARDLWQTIFQINHANRFFNKIVEGRFSTKHSEELLLYISCFLFVFFWLFLLSYIARNLTIKHV